VYELSIREVINILKAFSENIQCVQRVRYSIRDLSDCNNTSTDASLDSFGTNHVHGKTADFRFKLTNPQVKKINRLKRNGHQKNALEVLINVNM